MRTRAGQLVFWGRTDDRRRTRHASKWQQATNTVGGLPR